MTPAEMRITVAIHLGLPYAPLAHGAGRRCPCRASCGWLDSVLDRVLTCGGRGHVFTHGQRHAVWVTVWNLFFVAHGMRTAVEPRRAIQRAAPRCVVYDHMARDARGRLLGMDVTIRHSCPPRLTAFGSHAAFLRASAAHKRGIYRRSAWSAQPEVPVCIPLVASAFACVGAEAVDLFQQVVREAARSDAVMGDALRYQHLNRGQQVAYWRRRICIGLRMAVASQALARVHSAEIQMGEPSAASAAQSWAHVRASMLASRAAEDRPAAGAATSDGVGGAYFGAQPQDGVLGSGFARQCSAMADV